MSAESAPPTAAQRCNIHRPRDRRDATQHNTQCEKFQGHTGNHASGRLSRADMLTAAGASGLPAEPMYAVEWSSALRGLRNDTGPLPPDKTTDIFGNS